MVKCVLQHPKAFKNIWFLAIFFFLLCSFILDWFEFEHPTCYQIITYLLDNRFQEDLRFPQNDIVSYVTVWFNNKEVVVELRESKGSSCTLASVQSQLSQQLGIIVYIIYNLPVFVMLLIVPIQIPVIIYLHSH